MDETRLKTVVFAGPSIFGLDLTAFPNIEFRPPAAAGDMLDAVRDGSQVIGLIDGLYGDCAAVWHKEILFALSNGVAVTGAASMGALRAVECEPFGMAGVGAVFQDYRQGLRVSDADVAVSHAPADLAYRPITVALVDAEATILAMESQLGADMSSRLIVAARRRHFSSRTWRMIVADAGLDPDVAKTLSVSAVSVKRSDAFHLLTVMQGGEVLPDPSTAWKFQHTLFFENLASSKK